MADAELHRRYVEAIHEDALRPSGERVGIINACLAARDVHIEQLTVRLGQYADRAIANGERADKLLAAMGRIAEAHSKHIGEGGLTCCDCNECGHPHPCPTYIWATTDRDPLATWDPNDDDDEPDNPPTTTKETTT